MNTNQSKMKINYTCLFYLFLVLLVSCEKRVSNLDDYDIVIIGGGASGVMAGIQAARMGSKTLIVERTPWLGGMLTAAGVSAVDGNYELHSGLWEEFRQEINKYYGGEDSVKTGWVSNVMFEPQVGADILLQMATKEKTLKLWFESTVQELKRQQDKWHLVISEGHDRISISGKVLIDATELGDIAKMVGIAYDAGMDSRNVTGEEIAPEVANNIIQDLTYVAVLEEFDQNVDATIDEPQGYDPSLFYCTCAGRCDQDTIPRKLWDCDHMMKYGRLPNNKIMINWPIFGNDYYINAIDANEKERKEAFEKAKWFTKCYVYYLQKELGYKHIGIARDVFPTPDGFPMIPYHRESRRIKGKVRFTINDLARPFEQSSALYRTGIAVGDYPVDHHHEAYPDHERLPDLHFYPVPSYSLPLGTLIPQSQHNFLVAEKSISVTNLVNGTTRLQPVCMLLGQAAGTLASLSAAEGLDPSEIPVRSVQKRLLEDGAYILPYADVEREDPAWPAIQRIGATGILKGEGQNVGWRNFTFFHPDSVVTDEAIKGITDIFSESLNLSDGILTLEISTDIINKLINANSRPAKELVKERIQKTLNHYGWETVSDNQYLTRKQFAVLVDEIANPFDIPVDLRGNFLK